MKKRNPYAKAVTRIKPKIVRPKKGKGAKKRLKHIKRLTIFAMLCAFLFGCNKVFINSSPSALKPNIVCAGECFNEPAYVYTGNLRFYSHEL